jgi:hypothetical protein
MTDSPRRRTALSGALGWMVLGFALGGCGVTSVLGQAGAGGAGGAPNDVYDANGGYWTGPQAKGRKLDLLLVVDNSINMADKQAVLTQAVPQFLDRLITPYCLDGNGHPNGSQVDSAGNCTVGQPEARPLDDIHIGVVTSSLGGRGKSCTPGSTVNPLDDDRGELVGSLRHAGMAADGTDITYSTYQNIGFLAWDAKGTANSPSGTNDRAVLEVSLRKMIAAAGEQGCGYESPHEAWYRFLVDPEPPSDIVIDPSSSQTVAITNPPDQNVLDQRAAFLRPDSAVAIVVVSDETDQSIIDYGQGWLAAANDTPIPRPTSQCATNPNDPCCRNCQQIGDAYKNCPSPQSDPNCSKDDGDGNGPGYVGTRYNCACHRCWEMKRRFGFDLLFPIDRYKRGLSSSTVPNRAGKGVPNPLFAGGRSPSLVTFVGIVGVPWQDLATSPTLDAGSANLDLMSYDELTAAGRWGVILGDPNPPNNAAPIPPSDPFMNEAINPRMGINPDNNQPYPTSNPVTGQPIVAPTSTDPRATINGHEFNVNPAVLDDLQYACTFPLPKSRSCTDPAFTTSDLTKRRGCACKTSATDNPADRNRPICQPLTGGAAGTTQFSDKAYPGGRHLQILKTVGPRGVVGSICPKALEGDVTASGYGYNAVFAATLARLRQSLE